MTALERIEVNWPGTRLSEGFILLSQLNKPVGPLSPFAKEKCGWLYKKSGGKMGRWDKRFANLKDGFFRLYRSLQVEWRCWVAFGCNCFCRLTYQSPPRI